MFVNYHAPQNASSHHDFFSRNNQSFCFVEDSITRSFGMKNNCTLNFFRIFNGSSGALLGVTCLLVWLIKGYFKYNVRICFGAEKTETMVNLSQG